jgi:hypothetical protein
MEVHPLKYPFEATPQEIKQNPEPFVSSVFSCLESEFLIMPKGQGFIDYPVFERGYESIKAATACFQEMNSERVFKTITETPIALVVLRTMLGFTPPELAYLATQRSGIEVSQGFVRTIDRKIRMKPTIKLSIGNQTADRLKALIDVACHLLIEGAPQVSTETIHRLDKADTKSGLKTVKTMAEIGAPYAMLLYERFLGRPFAGHRDSVSDLVGDSLESAIEDVLSKAGITYRKTKRAERIEGLDQTPDFIIPTEFNKQILIEAKITEDDGTARDKATRIQHLGELSDNGRNFQVIACIAGRGFGVRREDMKKMLVATHGKVFTLKTLPLMVENTRLKEFKTI